MSSSVFISGIWVAENPEIRMLNFEYIQFEFNWLIGLMRRVFANGLGDLS